MRTITTSATLVLFISDTMSDQEAFATINRITSPLGVDFVWPANMNTDRPAIVLRIETPQVEGPRL